MNDSLFLLLIQNAALLITLAYIYSLLSVYEEDQVPLRIKWVLGGAVTAIGLSIMITSQEILPGVHFDARTILLANSGLFLGTIPTATAMVLMALFRWSMGGAGLVAGLALIVFAGLAGLVWRHFRFEKLNDISWRELYLFGLVTQLPVLLIFFLLPGREQVQAGLGMIGWPVAILYPAAAMLLGRMLSHRIQREQCANRLKESEERYRDLFERNDMIMLISDPDSGQVIDANPAAATFYGCTREEFLTKNMQDLFTGVGERLSDWSKHTTNGHTFTRYRHSVANGAVRYVEMYCGPINMEGRPLQFHVIWDATEAVKIEDRLIKSQRLEAVGRLAGGVAHDYNNKMQVVMGYTELCQREAADNPDMMLYLKEVEKAATQAAQLTLQLMAFARKQTIQPCILNLNSTIEEMLKVLKKMAGEDVEVTWKPEPDLWPVRIDPAQIDQVVVNLALNAREAMGDTGQLCIETQNVQVDDQTRQLIPHAEIGDYVMLAMTDTGKGMEPEVLEHIFEPFFSTKELVEGGGMGLATVYGIVKQNGGFVYAQSTLGQGASFKLFFPRNREKSRPETQPALLDLPRGKGETIWVVEDEEIILKLVRRTLQQCGYQVHSATNPEQALADLEANLEPIDLLLTDVVMPGMNGKTLYEKMKEKKPGLRVVYMSGYTATAIEQRGILDDGVPFLQKPFTAVSLCEIIHDSL